MRTSAFRVFTAAFAVLVLAAFPLAARAADVAQRRIIGFSPDGRYFAFLQFGIQDGSGAPYGDVFVIDLERDAYVKGTPLRARSGEEPEPLERTLAALKRRAAPLLARLGISLPGAILASRAPTQEGAENPQIAFHAHYNLRRPEHLVRYRIAATGPLAAAAPCPNPTDMAAGLRLEASWGGAPWGPVYQDRRVPRSRGCPQRYEIADVLAGPDMDNPLWHVVLVRYYRPGFEGLDGRYLAVPVRLRER